MTGEEPDIYERARAHQRERLEREGYCVCGGRYDLTNPRLDITDRILCEDCNKPVTLMGKPLILRKEPGQR